LKKAGFSEEQAAAIVKVHVDERKELATKQDIELVRKDLELAKRDIIIIALGGIVVITTGILLAAIKL
jgi:ribosomal protein L13E